MTFVKSIAIMGISLTMLTMSTIRVVEYHQMDKHGALPDPKHYDLNSLITMDIMLSDNESFEGGNFQTYEVDGTLKRHTFEQGDALILVSHKYHCVSSVTAGQRTVMVLEFIELIHAVAQTELASSSKGLERFIPIRGGKCTFKLTMRFNES